MIVRFLSDRISSHEKQVHSSSQKRGLFFGKNSALFLKKGPSFSRQTTPFFYLTNFQQIKD